jgi:tripartite-type tricarboxylate transporter receptor subunit TctC
MKLIQKLTLLILAMPLLASSQQNYPNRVIRLVVPYAAGGAGDGVARPLAQRLTEILGQPVIVDNRPGANAALGADLVAKAAPDGYNILLAAVVHYIVPMFSKSVPYDPIKDFTAIAPVVVTPNILAVHPSLPVKNTRELIDYAKKNPGKLFYGTTGVGSTHHLGGILFAQMAGIQMDHAPYKGGNPTISDALGGQIPVVILTSPTVLPHVNAGRLNAIGVIETKRARGTPDIPTLGETVTGYGLPDTWFGVLGPANMPKPLVDRLNAAIRIATSDPELRARLEKAGFEMSTAMTPDEFASSIRNDAEIYRRIVSTAGIKPE